jgi:hypothetical protein
MSLTVPGRLSYCLRAPRHMLVSEQCDHGEQSQQRRCDPADRLLRPMPLGLKAQALAYFLEGCLHLPTSHEPADDPLRVGAEIGAKERLGSELALRVSDQNPAQGHGGQPCAVPDGRVGDYLYGVRSSLPYQRATVIGLQTVAGSSATTERFASLSPLRRGLPIWPG